MLRYYGMGYGSFEEFNRQPLREIEFDYDWLIRKKKAEAEAAKGK